MSDEEAARTYCANVTGAEGMSRLESFIDMLRAENSRQNLVSDNSLDNVWIRHIADSLQLLTHVPRETGHWLDLGSGAGMPGLVIALARPELTMHLIESRKRRVAWLEAVAAHFGLSNCHVHGARLESVDSFAAGVITARAFAPLGKLLRLSARFSTRETVWLLPKGRSAAQELDEQPESIRSMFHVEQSLTHAAAGIVTGKGRPPVS